MAGTFINGKVNKNGSPALGDKFTSHILSSDPWAVVVTFKENSAFDADKTPIAVASPAGAPGSSATKTGLALQASNTSLTISTDSSEPISLYFSATDRGLGYY